VTPREFERRFEKYRPAIYKIAYSLWVSKIDAEEAVARVRAKFLQRVGSVNQEGFLALWRTSLQNDAISYLRKRKREVDIAEAADVRADAESMVEAGYSPVVIFALAALTEVERFVILSNVQNRIPLRKIAEALQVSYPTVSTIYRVARAKLVFELKDYALNHRMITPRDVTESVEWASRVLQQYKREYSASDIPC